MHFRDLDNALERWANGGTPRVEAWGADAVRVRAGTGGPVLDDLPGALLDDCGDEVHPIVVEHLRLRPYVLEQVRDDARLPLHEESA